VKTHDDTPKNRRLVCRFALSLLAAVLLFGSAVAQEYQIGPGDQLEIRFWQNTELNSEVRVGLDGNITLDIIGQIQAAGKTTEELQNDIVRQISRLNKNISQATVRVTAFNYQYVYVTGQVVLPGKQAFERIPDLWAIINEAGGPTPTADLSRVTIIRGGDESAGKVEIVNVADAIARERLNELPRIQRTDRIEVPQTVLGLPSAEIGKSSREKRNVVYVMGAVNTPGPIQFDDNVDLLEAVAMAGGPTERADLKKARVVTKDSNYGQALHFNLEKYTSTGHPNRYIVRKEDAIYIPPQQATFVSRLPTIAAGLGVITTAILIYNQVSNNDNNSNR
jgi:polysaccharide export outer membrane protein